MINETDIYYKEGLFHNAVKQSDIMAGNYVVLPKNASDLNTNNILSGIEIPIPGVGKYPLVACLPPVSLMEPTTAKGTPEYFAFTLLFLCTSDSTGDNQFKNRIPETNTSLHTPVYDWNDMKRVALSFLAGLESAQKKLLNYFHLDQRTQWRVTRLTKMQVDNVSGVMLQFTCVIKNGCTFDDIPADKFANIILPTGTHATHMH